MNSTITFTVTMIFISLMSSCSQSQEDKLHEARKKLYKDLEITSELSSVQDSVTTFYEQEYYQKHGKYPSRFEDVTYMDMTMKENAYRTTTLRILTEINLVDDKLRQMELGLVPNN